MESDKWKPSEALIKISEVMELAQDWLNVNQVTKARVVYEK